MTAYNETLTIDTCPLCKKKEVYQMKVVRSQVEQFMGESREKEFVRFFTCSEDSRVFQAVVSLLELPGTKIKDVQIIGGEGDGDE